MAVPVYDLQAARLFYRDILGCEEGRSSDTWVDFDLYGHQFVIHWKPRPPQEEASTLTRWTDTTYPFLIMASYWNGRTGKPWNAGCANNPSNSSSNPISGSKACRANRQPCSSSTPPEMPWSSKPSRTSVSCLPNKRRSPFDSNILRDGHPLRRPPSTLSLYMYTGQLPIHGADHKLLPIQRQYPVDHAIGCFITPAYGPPFPIDGPYRTRMRRHIYHTVLLQ